MMIRSMASEIISNDINGGTGPIVDRRPLHARQRQREAAEDHRAEVDVADAQHHAWLAAFLPSAACAAASRAIGTRKGEHDT